MSRRTDRVLVLVYVAITCAQVIAMWLHFRSREPDGALQPAPRPALALDEVLAERYQTQLATWFESRLPFKGTSVRLDNTLLYHVFDETKHGSTVRIGKDGVLFSNEDIAHYNKQVAALPSPEYVARLSDRLASLQRALAAQGRALVPIIIPAKTTIYRDAIPDAWTVPLGTIRPSDAFYEAVRRAFDERRLRYVDARAMLARSTQQRAIVWGVWARHWSMYTVCLAMTEIATAYAELSGKPRPAHECHLELVPARRSHPDFDLRRLLNALYVGSSVRSVAAAKHAIAPGDGPKPSATFISTSFAQMLAEDAHASAAFGAINVNYYNQVFVPMPYGDEIPVVAGSPAWRAATLDRDLYVVDLFEGYMFVPGAFVETWVDAMEAFR